jgi:hypothetical protein
MNNWNGQRVSNGGFAHNGNTYNGDSYHVHIYPSRPEPTPDIGRRIDISADVGRDGETPLNHAVLTGRCSVVEMILNSDSEHPLDAVNKDGNTALALAFKLPPSWERVKMLLLLYCKTGATTSSSSGSSAIIPFTRATGNSAIRTQQQQAKETDAQNGRQLLLAPVSRNSGSKPPLITQLDTSDWDGYCENSIPRFPTRPEEISNPWVEEGDGFDFDVLALREPWWCPKCKRAGCEHVEVERDSRGRMRWRCDTVEAAGVRVMLGIKPLYDPSQQL